MKIKYTLPYVLGGMITLGIFNSSAANHGVIIPNYKTPNIDSAYLPAHDSTNVDINWNELTPHAIEASEYKKEVLYVLNTGDTIRRQGGSRAWRNNNPGCLVYGKFTRERGAIGKGGKFAVFPDYETGLKALVDLLLSKEYINLSIERAITKYAPPYENNVARYKKRLRNLTKLPLVTKIRDLDSTALTLVANAICTIEGWSEGQTEHRPANANMMAATKTKQMRDSIQHTL